MSYKTLRPSSTNTTTHISSPSEQRLKQNSHAYHFLQQHELAVLSTKDRYDNVTGAVVYYTFDYDQIYILTKEGTKKARNMLRDPQVAMTIYDADRAQTVQLQGRASVELDSQIRNFVYWQIVKANSTTHPKSVVPVTKVQAGGFIVFRITPHQINYFDFSD